MQPCTPAHKKNRQEPAKIASELLNLAQSGAVNFDMDGLMVDSEGNRSLAFEEAIRKFGGTPQYHANGVVQTIGINVRENCEAIRETHGLNASIDDLVSEHEAAYTRLLARGVSPMPGLLELVGLLDEHCVKKTVVSSSSRRHIGMVVAKLWQKSPFDLIVSGEEVERGKPAPDIFLRAAKLLGVAASGCVVLEDAESGIRGAKDAGMKAIAVPTKYTIGHDFSLADAQVSSLEDVNLELLARINTTML